MTYYHPFSAGRLVRTHDLGALQAAVDGLHAFNQLLTGLYTSAGDSIADVEADFSNADLGDADGNGMPDDVDRSCAWTWRCASPPLGPDIHPNNTGYAAIAHAFAQALS